MYQIWKIVLFKQYTTSFCGLLADKPRGMLVKHDKNS